MLSAAKCQGVGRVACLKGRKILAPKLDDRQYQPPTGSDVPPARGDVLAAFQGYPKRALLADSKTRGG
jgi:hypothetical protein